MVARSRHPDVIVLDLILPGIDGRETAVRLKDQPGTGDIPIVVLSVLTAEEMPVEGSVSRVDKPVAEDALFEALRQALADRRWWWRTTPSSRRCSRWCSPAMASPSAAPGAGARQSASAVG